MNAIDFLKTKTRICEMECTKCPLSSHHNSKRIPCGGFQRDFPEETVEIVEKWAKENPVKTYLSVLLEKLPNAKLNEKGLPTCICPNMIFEVENGCRKGQFMTCLECWNREYKEED